MQSEDRNNRSSVRTARTASDALVILWRAKTFLKPKDVKNIESELEKRGYNFSDKNLMMALKRAKFLTRKGKRGEFTYVQRHPYIEGDD